MIVNFDHFNKCENPILTICNPNNKTLSVIANYTDLELEPNFSAISTVKLTVYKYIKDKVSDSEDNKKREADCWKYLAECRQIHVENIGYFPIISVTTNDNKDNPSCEIEADSCESEWNNHGIALSAGVYQFYDATKPNDTILGKILNLCPTWNIGYISPTVANTFRTFDDLEKSVYQFLMEDCTNAYECFIVPDIQNRTISVYSSHDEIPNTDILLTYDNVLKNCKIERLAENIYTALKVTGGEDSSSSDNSELSIISANPLGTDTIYNFSYFMKPEWMTQGLIDAINAWNKKISDSQTNYNTIISSISTAESEYATIDGQLSDATAQLNAYKDEMNALQSTDQSGYAQAKAKFDAQQVVVNNIKSQLDAKQTTINGYTTQLTALQNSLSIESNFTHEQILELTPYIKQTTYKDENITVTDNMTWAERYAQIKTLYTRGVNKLAELSQPTYTITIECVNFAFIKEFEHFRSQFNLGNMIHVENDPQGDILNFIILSYDIKYNSYDLEIKLSNKLKPHDAYSKTKDLYSNLSNSASTLSVNKNSWSYPVKSGTISDLKDFMNKPLNLSVHELVTKNQSPLVDEYGIHGRKINADGSIDPEQLDIRNNEIAFTTDGGNTIKSAFGKMQRPDGTNVYGLNADAVVAGTIDASLINVINLNASNITTGTLNADLITSGKIQSKNGGVYFDLDNNALAVEELLSSKYPDTYMILGRATLNNVKYPALGIQHNDVCFMQIREVSDSGDVVMVSPGNIIIGTQKDIHIESNNIAYLTCTNSVVFGNGTINTGIVDSNGFHGKINNVDMTTAYSGTVSISPLTLHYQNGILVSVDG